MTRQPAHGWYDRERKLGAERKRRHRAKLPRCAVKECETVAHYKHRGTFGLRLLCHRHWLLQTEHEKIVARIRAIPIRTVI